MTYRVTWHPEVEHDLEELGDQALVSKALELMLDLRENPHRGDQLRERHNMQGLADSRSIKFDREDWTARPRYRVVYENQPSDGAPDEARVYAVALRDKLQAYARALSRISAEKRPAPRRRRGA